MGARPGRPGKPPALALRRCRLARGGVDQQEPAGDPVRAGPETPPVRGVRPSGPTQRGWVPLLPNNSPCLLLAPLRGPRYVGGSAAGDSPKRAYNQGHASLRRGAEGLDAGSSRATLPAGFGHETAPMLVMKRAILPH